MVLVGGVLMITTACEKGENDPAISLSTRTARLSGEYTIDSWVNSYTNVYSNGDVEEVVLSIEGSAGTRFAKYTPDGGGTTTISSQTITVEKATFSFTKEGNWTAVLNKVTKWSVDGDFIVDHYYSTQTEKSTESGSRVFLTGQADDFKNKERVLVGVLNSEYSSKLD